MMTKRYPIQSRIVYSDRLMANVRSVESILGLDGTWTTLLRSASAANIVSQIYSAYAKTTTRRKLTRIFR